MAHARVDVIKYRLRGRGHNGPLVIRACEPAHGVRRFEEGQGHQLRARTVRPAQEIRAGEPVDVRELSEHLRSEDVLVRIGAWPVDGTRTPDPDLHAHECRSAAPGLA